MFSQSVASACGSGMPMPRLKQAAACFLIELGNGDKFIFDMGTGSMERIYALGIPLDFIDKVFLTCPWRIVNSSIISKG